MRFADLVGRQVVIWGYGREGQAAYRRCLEIGVTPTIAEPDLGEAPAFDAAWGPAGAEALLNADIVIKSPGVPVTSDLYRAVLAQGVTITSVTDLWLHENAQRTIAVTGTKGKSTTAALIDHLLRGLGTRSVVLGNIGHAVLDEPEPHADIVVLEVSSYQAQSLSTSPRWAVFTSLFPEHLTWHGSEEAYFNDKLHLVDAGSEWVLSADQPELVDRLRSRVSGLSVIGADTVHPDGADVVWPGGFRISGAELPLIGTHNAANIALALTAVCRLLELDPDTSAERLAATLATFRPLAHRLETVPSDDGRRWIDDGLATAPAAVVASIQALGEARISVIVGGADRGLDFSLLIDYLRSATNVNAILIGASGTRIAEQLTSPEITTEWRVADSFAAAACWAHSAANPAEIVLLSPGAPSQDEYRDYVERADAFRRIALGGTN